MSEMRLVREIDWDAWKPHDDATLLFVIRGGEALLIRKLRGLGAGKINAPGGRLEPGETPVEAAIRETMEEVGVRPIQPRPRGELWFQFVDGYALHCHVFSADGCEGEPHSTDEAIPQWTSLSALPYNEMWADDSMWLPLMLAGRTPFKGWFTFDGETMLDHRIESHDPAQALYAKLDELGIASHEVAHPPVFTVAEAKKHRAQAAGKDRRDELPERSQHRVEDGLHVKNMFLRNKKGREWLVTTHEDRPVDLKSLARTLDAGHLSFASVERLRNSLGVEAGSVTPLAALNDARAEVTVVLEEAIATASAIHCHPLTNDRTIRLSGADLVRFLEATGHPPRFI